MGVQVTKARSENGLALYDHIAKEDIRIGVQDSGTRSRASHAGKVPPARTPPHAAGADHDGGV